MYDNFLDFQVDKQIGSDVIAHVTDVHVAIIIRKKVTSMLC
jgi:hypothetical protein